MASKKLSSAIAQTTKQLHEPRQARQGEINLLSALLTEPEAWLSNFLLRKKYDISAQVIKLHILRLKENKYLEINPQKKEQKSEGGV